MDLVSSLHIPHRDRRWERPFSGWSIQCRARPEVVLCTHVLNYSCTDVAMYSSTYVFMYSCTYVLMYSCTYILMYSCTHVMMYSGTHVQMYLCTYVLMYLCTHVLIYLCNYVLMCSCTHVLMYSTECWAWPVWRNPYCRASSAACSVSPCLLSCYGCDWWLRWRCADLRHVRGGDHRSPPSTTVTMSTCHHVSVSTYIAKPIVTISVDNLKEAFLVRMLQCDHDLLQDVLGPHAKVVRPLPAMRHAG